VARFAFVSVSRALLLISTVAAALSVTGSLFSDARLSLQGGLAVLVALVGYVIVAGRGTVPRTRWALAAGVGMLAVGMALQLYWYSEATEDFGWFAYSPLYTSGAPTPLLDLSRQSVDRLQIVAFLHLLAALCFAVGVFALPAWHRPKRAGLTAVLALVLLAFVGVNVGGWFDGSAVLDALGTVWPALLATLVAVGLVVLAGRRADHAWLVAAGTVLVAVVAATVFDDLAGAWSGWWMLAQPEDNTAAPQLAVSVGFRLAADSSPEVTAALKTAAELAGPALLAVGALRASRAA
jgi:hypothetical protein